MDRKQRLARHKKNQPSNDPIQVWIDLYNDKDKLRETLVNAMLDEKGKTFIEKALTPMPMPWDKK